jgi:hypothetical protein
MPQAFILELHASAMANQMNYRSLSRAASSVLVCGLLAGAAEAASKGYVGVCVRWANDPDHVAEAVVIEPSGDRQFDESFPDAIRAHPWPAPTGDYNGAWLGIWMVTTGQPPADRFPDCSRLPMPPVT